ncbi:MAG: hypothetical protein HOC23_12715 [Halieaceae bacterium]|nr:hypothetical protein [Halieaceae bacterium]
MLAWMLVILALSTGLEVSAHNSLDDQIIAANQSIAHHPTALQPRLALAELHRRHGDFNAALRDLDEAHQLAPGNASTHYFRGLVLLDAARPLEAEVSLRYLLKLEPIHPQGHEARARALIQLQRPLDAAHEYDLTIVQQPIPVPDHYLARARAFAAAGSQYLEVAIRGLDEGIAIMGPILTLQRTTIDFELRRGETRAALARLNEVIDAAPRPEAWLAQRGEILAQAGQVENAKQSFNLALAELAHLSTRKRQTPAMSDLEASILSSLADLPEQAARISLP